MATTLYELALRLTTTGAREAIKGLADVDSAGKKTGASLGALEARGNAASKGIAAAGAAAATTTTQINLAGSASKLLAGGLAVFSGGAALTAAVQFGLGLIAAGYRALSTEGQLATKVAGELAEQLRRGAQSRFERSVQGAQANEMRAMLDVMRAQEEVDKIGQRWFGNRRIFDAAQQRLLDAQRNYGEATIRTAEAMERSASRQVTAINKVTTAHVRATRAAAGIVDETTPNRGPHMDNVFDPMSSIPGGIPFPTGPLSPIRPSQLPDLSRGPAGEQGIFDQAVADTVEAADEAARGMQMQLASIFGNALINGVLAGIQDGGIFGAFKTLTASILQGFGDMCVQIGIKAIAAAKLTASITKFLMAHPLLALAGGVALVALGSSIGGRNGGGRTEFYTADPGRGTEEVTRLKFINRDGSSTTGLTPRPFYNINIIGPNDPAAGRQIAQMLDNHYRR